MIGIEETRLWDNALLREKERLLVEDAGSCYENVPIRYAKALLCCAIESAPGEKAAPR